MDTRLQIPKSILTTLNQLYELDQKLKKQDDPTSISRNISKIKDAFAEEGLLISDMFGGQKRIGLAYEDPMSQPFTETRTDLDASIAGSTTDDLVVVEVIKPIIRAFFLPGGASEFSVVVQKGVVIVESRKDQ